MMSATLKEWCRLHDILPQSVILLHHARAITYDSNSKVQSFGICDGDVLSVAFLKLPAIIELEKLIVPGGTDKHIRKRKKPSLVTRYVTEPTEEYCTKKGRVVERTAPFEIQW